MKTFSTSYNLNFKLFQNTAFSSFIIFKRTCGTSILSNYIYFAKTTNEWIVGDTCIIKPFGNLEMPIFKIKQLLHQTLLLRF